jgi:hypothetical protein
VVCAWPTDASEPMPARASSGPRAVAVSRVFAFTPAPQADGP